MRQITIPCAKCCGKGVICLPEPLQEVVDVLLAHPGASTYEVFRWIPSNRGGLNIQITAINNRLNALVEFGIVRREGSGSRYRPYAWYLVPQDAQNAQEGINGE